MGGSTPIKHLKIVSTKDTFIKMDAMKLSEETIDLSNQDISKLTKEGMISQLQMYELNCYESYKESIFYFGRLDWRTRKDNKEWCNVNTMLKRLNIPRLDEDLRRWESI